METLPLVEVPISVREREHISQNIRINEITLREESALDVWLTLEQKVLMAKKLDELGVQQIQIHSGDAKDLIPACRKAGVKADIEVMSRPYHPFDYSDYGGRPEKASWTDEVEVCREADILRIDLPLHPAVLDVMGWTKDDVIRYGKDGVKYAREIGFKEICYGIPLATQVDVRHVKEICNMMVNAGATNIGIADTGAAMRPTVFKWFIEQVKKTVDVPIAVHCHNDFGLATANALAAVEGGAEILDGIMNGADLAHSASAPLEEVVMGLKYLYGVDLGMKTEKFAEVSELFSKLTNVPVPFLKPIVGSWVGSVTKREHIYQYFKNGRFLTAPFHPSAVGRKMWQRVGRHSGPVIVKMKLKELGLTAPDDKISSIVKAVDETVKGKRRLLTDDEFRELVKKLS